MPIVYEKPLIVHRRTVSQAIEQVYSELLEADRRAGSSGEALLTPAGVSYLRQRVLPGRDEHRLQEMQAERSKGDVDLLPYWDASNRQLFMGAFLVKEFRQPAPYQTILLDVFQEEGWDTIHIDDPLPRGENEGEEDAKRRLLNTIKNLNRTLPPGTIRFRGDGTGQGVSWGYDRAD